jgi:hypothetical protein
VNFLLHRHLASRDLLSATAGIGAMLPDLWRMADRRVRPAMVGAAERRADHGELTALLAGIDHHLGADRWFHASDVLADGERLTLAGLRASQVEAPKVGLFAHVAWELLLDGALLRREGLESTLSSLRQGFAAAGGEPADRAASLHHFDRAGRTASERTAFDAGMRRLFTQIGRGPWIAGYQRGRGVALRIEGIRTRIGFDRFSAADRDRLADVFDRLGSHADAALVQVLG